MILLIVIIVVIFLCSSFKHEIPKDNNSISLEEMMFFDEMDDE